MKRRTFFHAATGTGVLAAGIPVSCKPAVKPPETAKITEIGDMNLDTLYKELHTELFDIFLPIMDKWVIDREYGGFMCNARCDGVHTNTNKRTWYEGRGTWVYSYLYNNFDRNPKYLEVARKSVQFILKTNPPPKTLWGAWFTREGKQIGGPDTDIYSDIFVAEGLQEYAVAANQMWCVDAAQTIVFKIMDIYDNSPDYQTVISGTMAAGGAKLPQGARILGHWMLIFRLIFQMQQKFYDVNMAVIEERCLDAFMNKHYNPEYGLFNEYRNHDFSPIEDERFRNYCVGHGHEGLWMVMDKAVKDKDKKLFDTCAERLKRMIEVFWDDVYGGEFQILTNVDKNEWEMSKTLWLHTEILIGTMMVIEHTGADWAKFWYARNFHYIRDKLDLRNYGYQGWMLFPDRKATFDPNYDRICNFHKPRQLMLNLLAIERIQKRGGNTSGIFG
jgi:N-acylglucosamine 2-epimerase